MLVQHALVIVGHEEAQLTQDVARSVLVNLNHLPLLVSKFDLHLVFLGCIRESNLAVLEVEGLLLAFKIVAHFERIVFKIVVAPVVAFGGDDFAG